MYILYVTMCAQKQLNRTHFMLTNTLPYKITARLKNSSDIKHPINTKLKKNYQKGDFQSNSFRCIDYLVLYSVNWGQENKYKNST